MMNPHLRDTVERIIRDPRRKLGWDDRLIGTLRLALRQGITPRCYACGAAAALQYLTATEPADSERALSEIWGAAARDNAPEAQRIRSLIAEGAAHLKGMMP
jgi:mannitol-1-phosphate 5-dehydrogenase